MAGWVLLGVPTSVAAADWSSLKIGAGGFITGMSQANDGTMFIRTDTAGAYKWNASNTTFLGNDSSTGAWEQIIKVNRFPSNMRNNPELYNDGVYELVVAPNDSSRV